MRIVNKIIDILESMVTDVNCPLQSYQYNDRPTANVRLDNGKPSPTALFLQVTDFEISLSNIGEKERCSIALSFLEKENKLDAQGYEQETIVDRMKGLAVDFLMRLKNDRTLSFNQENIKVKSVFLNTDSNRSGVMLMMDLTEKQGRCI